MTSNPYINQSDWGRDLLARLSNFSDDDGSFNTWTQLPTVGKNGNPLGQEHAGYSGILLGPQASIQRWDGQKWVEYFRVPVSTKGVSSPTLSVSLPSALSSNVFVPDFSSNRFIYVRTNDDGLLYVDSYNITTGELQWAVTRSLPAGSPNALWFTTAVTCDAASLYIALALSASVADITTNRQTVVFAFNLTTGGFLWQSVALSTSQFEGPANMFLRPGQSQLVVCLGSYEVNKRFFIINSVTGSVIASANLIGGGGASYGPTIGTPNHIVTLYSTTIHVHDYNLESVKTFSVGSGVDRIIQSADSSETCLLVQDNILRRYNIGTNTLTQIQTLETGEFLINNYANATRLTTLTGTRVNVRELANDGTFLKIEDYVPAGEGHLFFPGSHSPFPMTATARRERILRGWGATTQSEWLVQVGQQNKQSLNFEDSVVLQSANTPVNRSVNLNSLSVDDTLINRIQAQRITVLASANQNASDDPARPDHSIGISDLCYFFGVNGRISGGSIGYTGSNDSNSYACGWLVNCEYI